MDRGTSGTNNRLKGYVYFYEFLVVHTFWEFEGCEGEGDLLR